MSVQSVYNNVATANTNAVNKAVDKPTKEVKNTAAEAAKGFEETAVVYEKSNTAETTAPKKNNAIDRDAIIAQMKADQEARMNQLVSLVQNMIKGQGKAIGTADSIWSFLAEGNFTVSADVKAQAQADIAEDGYWGVEQTSDRILDFAKALAGNDPSKADELLDAFKKGFKEATGAWGKDLPEISQRTYDAVEEKFEAWKNEGKTTAEGVEA